MICLKLWLSCLPYYILEMLCTWGEKSIQNESIHFSGVRLLTGIALLYYSGEASDNLIIFMGTIHRGNGANNDTFNKVGGVSQWQNSPIKRTPHLLRYHLQFTWLARFWVFQLHALYILQFRWPVPGVHVFIQDIDPVWSFLVRVQFWDHNNNAVNCRHLTLADWRQSNWLINCQRSGWDTVH